MNDYLSLINSKLNLPERKSLEHSVSVFSGGGGLDLGLAFAGFNLQFACDSESVYCETISKNFPDCRVCARDISEITASDIFTEIGNTSIELLSGGSPCQSFSILGQRKSFEDSRGKLAFEFIRLVKELSPRAFIFENVPGILNLNSGRDWGRLISEFNDTGYKIYNKVLNAADFGVPQIRKRIFVIGFRDQNEFEFPQPSHQNYFEQQNLLEPVLPTWFPAKLALEKVDGLQNHDIRPHGDRVKNRYEKILPGGRDSVDHTSRIDPEKPAGTVLVGSKAGGGRPHIHPYFPRHITAREAARLQSFPDWYIFNGQQTSQYRQVGNAVPPLLAFALGNEIRKSLVLSTEHKRLACAEVNISGKNWALAV